jgi:hypothetical protein
MRCSQCGFESPEGMRFCGQCASPLGRSCPQCGFENPLGFAFCRQCATSLTGVPSAPSSPPPTAHPQPPQIYTPKHLAEKILTSRRALEGERRQVTVLFADVAGFTTLAEQLDPEEVHQIIDGCFERITAEVHRFEGTINQYTGDGVMALFGAPIAHEDGPRRAVCKKLGRVSTPPSCIGCRVSYCGRAHPSIIEKSKPVFSKPSMWPAASRRGRWSCERR